MKLTKVAPLTWKNEAGQTYDMQDLLEMGYHFINGEPVMPIPIPVALSFAENDAKQVRFRCLIDEDDELDRGGILFNHFLICGDCGGAWDLNYDSDEVIILEVFEDWVDLTELIY